MLHLKWAKELREEGTRLGREGLSQRVIELVDGFDGSYMGAMELAGALKAIAQAAKSDDYWTEKVERGFHREMSAIRHFSATSVKCEGKDNWNKPDITPNVQKHDYAEFIVAMKFPNKAKPVVMSAFYLNAYPLVCEWGCVTNLSDEECQKQHENGAPVTGWYEGRDYEGEPNGAFYLLTKEAKLLGWQLMPEWSPERMEKDNG